MKIPYFDLKRQYQYIGKEIESNVVKSLRSTQYSLGPEVEKFEKKYANYISTNYCTGVNTGTSALHLALLACGIGVGDEVITVSMTFVASVMSISYTGAKPVFVDVCFDTQLMNFEKGIENNFESSALIGNSYSKNYIQKKLSNLSYEYDYVDLGNNVFSDIADEINKGKVVGIFQDKMEWGPRALSSRSILANPRKSGINKELNFRLNRSDFMPFAPVVLDEDMEEIFLDWSKNDRTSQYMTSTYNVNTKFESLMPAVVHVDKTARPQSVSKKEYPFLYEVLKEIKKLSGMGVTINTSFNLHEEPIVQSPKDALIALKKSAIDILYFESLKVKLKVKKI